MYKSIAKVYDYIFPQNINQLNFIDSIKPISKHETILEIGCATGNLTELLYTKSAHVIGLDLDDTLLEEASKKYPDMTFINENMLNISNLERNFDRIVCFGNTLVHLPDRDAVNLFFNRVYEQLNDSGLFIVQIINYDRIITHNINHLPTIENDHIKFTRDYDLKDGYVSFDTELLIKETSQVIKSKLPLLTLKQNEIQTYLENAGFKDIQFYGNLKGDKIQSTDIPLLFSCIK
ncbi:MAG: class I SAM-dependent methyltransferase [Clostridiales bacterium]|nr:class I SAM-dependent methyltransferase [Clostridiales bacterium]